MKKVDIENVEGGLPPTIHTNQQRYGFNEDDELFQKKDGYDGFGSIGAQTRMQTADTNAAH